MQSFNYPDLQTAYHNNMRFYGIPNGEWYPSITTVLGVTQPPEVAASFARWREAVGNEEADRVSLTATTHGTNVHLLLERHFKDEDILAPINGEEVPSGDYDAYKALKPRLKRITAVYGQECALFSNELTIAGRCDLVGEYQNVPAIVDFKTAKRIKSDEDIADYKLQLCFYANAHNEMFGTNIQRGVIIMIVQAGFPMEFIVDLEPQLALLKARSKDFWTLADLRDA